MARPRTPLLSRDGIVAAALTLVDAEGLEALSTRRLAAELGVSGPSLYNHVATKDELIDAVVDCVVAGVDVSPFEGLGDGLSTSMSPGWRGALATWARSYREALAAHPNVVPALARSSGRRPAQLHIADAVFGGLVAAGWPRREATSIGALMRSLVIGSALGSFAASFPADASVYAGVYPHLDQAHLLAEHQREIDDRAFEVGLTAVLDGLELRFAALGGGGGGGAAGGALGGDAAGGARG